jgi:steroid 5-alpha reductase family enzyme
MNCKPRVFHLLCLLAVISSTVAFTSSTALTKPKTSTLSPISSTTKTLRPQSTKLESVVVPEIWTSLLPTSLGFVKSEYGHSYAYGFGTALSAISILKRFPNSMFPLHACAIIFYGLRLNAFLFLRTLISQRQREMIERIEAKAVKRGNRFTTRTPMLLSTGLLYYALAAPALLTAKLSADLVPSWGMSLLKTLIGLQWFGFGIAALGDLTKTYVKQTQKDEYYLVSSGIFSMLRHPNYSGEIIGWTANIACAIVAATFLLKQGIVISTVSNLVGSALGWMGMLFVLLRASTSLEKKQKETYGSDTRYQDWIKSSWKGWTLPAEEEPHADPHLEFKDVIEDSGSGI